MADIGVGTRLIHANRLCDLPWFNFDAILPIQTVSIPMDLNESLSGK